MTAPREILEEVVMKLLIGVLIFALTAGCTGATSTVDSPSATSSQPAASAAPEFDTWEYRIRVVTVADNLEYPYSMTFLPDGGLLFTEMPGRVRLIRDGKLLPDPVATIPGVHHDKASKGLMDIALHPKFAENHFVYITYNKSGEKGVTEIGRASCRERV